MKETLTPQIDLAQRISTIANDVKKRIKPGDLAALETWNDDNLFTDNTAINMIVDVETGAIEKVNKAAVLQYGFSQDEFLQMKFDDLLAQIEDYLPGLDLDIVYPAGEFVNNDILQHCRKDGSMIYVEFTSELKTINKRQKRHFILKKFP